MTIIIRLLRRPGAVAATSLALGGILTHIETLVVAVHGLAAVPVVVAAHVVLFPLGRGHFRRMPFAPFGATVLEPDLQKNQQGYGEFNSSFKSKVRLHV